MSYSPRQIFSFLTDASFRDIIGKSFYKRHMESDDTESPFNDPESIIFLEWLIDHNYIIAEYRHSDGVDNESYLLSTLGHAFLKNYRQSHRFRLASNLHHQLRLYGVILLSALGSLIASFLSRVFIEN